MYLILRRHWHLFLITIAVIVGSIVLLGDVRVIPYTVSSDWHQQDLEDELAVQNYYGSGVDLFDSSFVHTIQIEMDPDQYDNMILTFEETGEKDYYPVNITIDGTTVPSAGIRLKGNSSLSEALGIMMGPGADKMTEEQMEKMRGGSQELEVPYLIKFNEFVGSQNYQGYEEIALRNNFQDTSYMREFISYEILEEMGVEAPQASYTGVSFNEDQEVLFIAVEHIDEEFIANHFDEDPAGDLIKKTVPSEKAGGLGGFEYFGQDPLDYEGKYRLETNTDTSDLYDLIDFLGFIDESRIDEFEEQLRDYIDFESLFKYLAFCNITVNMDSFPGNGNNYYLYQKTDETAFTLVPWDLNQAFGSFWMGRGGQPQTMSLFFEAEEGEMMMEEGMMLPPIDQNGNPIMQRQAPENYEPMDHEKMKEMMEKMKQGLIEGNFGNFIKEKPDSGTNILVDKLFESEKFKSAYLKAVSRLLESQFEFEALEERVEELRVMIWEGQQERGFLLEPDKLNEGISELLQFIASRIEFIEEELYNLEAQK